MPFNSKGEHARKSLGGGAGVKERTIKPASYARIGDVGNNLFTFRGRGDGTPFSSYKTI